METTGKTPNCISHVYKVSKTLQSYTIYELVEVINGKNILTDLIRIEPYQGKSKATNLNHYLRLRTTNNWSKCEQVSGLRPTKFKEVYYGDRNKNDKKSLLIFQYFNHLSGMFGETEKHLKIDVYPNYYPFNNTIRQNTINNYAK